MSTIIFILAATTFFAGLFLLIKLNIYNFPALFFAIKFITGRVIQVDRVRYAVIIQLLIIMILLITIIIRSGGELRIRDQLFCKFIPALLAFLFFYTAIGMINGYSNLQILIDCYKYLDIIVYYILLRASWKDNVDVLQGIKALSILMLILGTLEIFITERGGVGLNLIISLFPMTILLSLYNYILNPKIIFILSILILVTCQTRTYILGFVIGLIVLLTQLPKDKIYIIFRLILSTSVFGVIAIGIFSGRLFEETLDRFIQLSSGFEESGGYRIYDYQEAFNRFLDYPILGNGFGYLKRTFILKMGWMDWGDFVHCFYLEMLFKTGVCGVAYLILIFGKFIKHIWHQVKKMRDNNSFVFSICCGSICSFISWIFIYSFAPLSTIGTMFFAPLIASITLSNYYDEHYQDEGEGFNYEKVRF